MKFNNFKIQLQFFKKYRRLYKKNSKKFKLDLNFVFTFMLRKFFI